MSSGWEEIVFVVPHSSMSDPLVYLFYIKDMPPVCRHLEAIQFIEDKNLTEIAQRRVNITLLKLILDELV